MARTAFPTKDQIKRATAAVIEAAQDARIPIGGIRVMKDGSIEIMGQVAGQSGGTSDFDKFYGNG